MSVQQLNVGFIGLGDMGGRMAMNVVKARFPLTVFDLRPSSVEKLVNKGAIAGLHPADVAKGSGCILLSLPGFEQVEEVIFGQNGMIDTLSPGSIVVDLSTIDYLKSLEIKEKLQVKGIIFIDAPVSGGDVRAGNGTLTIMVGGDPTAFERIRIILNAIGNNIVYMGQSGSGQLTKLVNMLFFNTCIAAMAEILPMAVKLGLDSESVIKVVTTGTGKNFALDFYSPNILEDNFTVGFTLNKAYKDVISTSALCSKMKFPMPVVHAAMQTYQMAMIEGFGDLNKGAMIKVWEKLLGVEVRKKS